MKKRLFCLGVGLLMFAFVWFGYWFNQGIILQGSGPYNPAAERLAMIGVLGILLILPGAAIMVSAFEEENKRPINRKQRK